MRYMVHHQIHFGRDFYLDKKKGYWISTDYPRIRAHRWVWINSHGPIPKGYHIHHRNGNKSDNRLENLELIERSRHLSHHMKDPERRRKAAIHFDKIRHLAKKWHASEEGVAWHRLHAIKCEFGKLNPKDYICLQCSSYFKSPSPGRVKFCSNNCKSAWRRKLKIDHIQVFCEFCKKAFFKNKYFKTKYCSRRCAHAKRKMDISDT